MHWIARWFWSPVVRGENWAQTLVRVSGSLARWAVSAAVIVGGAIGLSQVNHTAQEAKRLRHIDQIDISITAQHGCPPSMRQYRFKLNDGSRLAIEADTPTQANWLLQERLGTADEDTLLRLEIMRRQELARAALAARGQQGGQPARPAQQPLAGEGRTESTKTDEPEWEVTLSDGRTVTLRADSPEAARAIVERKLDDEESARLAPPYLVVRATNNSPETLMSMTIDVSARRRGTSSDVLSGRSYEIQWDEVLPPQHMLARCFSYFDSSIDGTLALSASPINYSVILRSPEPWMFDETNGVSNLPASPQRRVTRVDVIAR